jgi:hypothetical protein
MNIPAKNISQGVVYRIRRVCRKKKRQTHRKSQKPDAAKNAKAVKEPQDGE